MKRRVKVVNLMMIAALIVALAPAGMYINKNTLIMINICPVGPVLSLKVPIELRTPIIFIFIKN